MKANMSKHYILIITLITFYSINLNSASAQGQETAQEHLDKLYSYEEIQNFKSIHTKEVVEAFFQKFMSDLNNQSFALNKRIKILKLFLGMIDIKLIRLEDSNSTDIDLYSFVNGLRFNIQNLINFSKVIRIFLTTNDAEVVTKIFNRFMTDLEKSDQSSEHKINSLENFIKLFERKIKKSANAQNSFTQLLEQHKAKLVNLKATMIAVQARLDAQYKQDVMFGFL